MMSIMEGVKNARPPLAGGKKEKEKRPMNTNEILDVIMNLALIAVVVVAVAI